MCGLISCYCCETAAAIGSGPRAKCCPATRASLFRCCSALMMTGRDAVQLGMRGQGSRHCHCTAAASCAEMARQEGPPCLGGTIKRVGNHASCRPRAAVARGRRPPALWRPAGGSRAGPRPAVRSAAAERGEVVTHKRGRPHGSRGAREVQQAAGAAACRRHCSSPADHLHCFAFSALPADA